MKVIAYITWGNLSVWGGASGLSDEASLSLLTDIVAPAVNPYSAADPHMVGMYGGNLADLGTIATIGHALGLKVAPYLYTDSSGSHGPTLAQIISAGTLNDLVSSISSLLTAYDLDGIVLDPEDGSSSTTINTVLAALSSISPKYIDVTGRPYTATNVAIGSASYVRYIQVMTYDMGWVPNTAGYPQASVAATQAGMQMWVAEGWPKSKLIMGIPFYGRTAYDAGYSGYEQESKSYKDIVTELNPASSTDYGTLAFSGSGASRLAWWGGPNTDKLKTTWALGEGYAGVMVFSLGYDQLNDPRSLLRSIVDSGPLDDPLDPVSPGDPYNPTYANYPIFNNVMKDIVLEINQRKIYNDIRSQIDVTESSSITEGGTTSSKTVSYNWTNLSPGATKDVTLPVNGSDIASSWWGAACISARSAVLTGMNESSCLGINGTWHLSTSTCIVENFAGLISAQIISQNSTSCTVRVTNNGSVTASLYAIAATYSYAATETKTTTTTNQRTLMVRAIDQTSIDKYGRRTLNLTWPLGQTQTQMQSLVEQYLAKYKEPIPILSPLHIQGSDDELIAQIFTRKISDKITVTNSELLMYAQPFYINRISTSHDVKELLECDWECESVGIAEQYTLFTLDQSLLDGNDILA